MSRAKMCRARGYHTARERVALLLAALLLFSAPSRTQDDPRFRIRTTTLVVVPVTVKSTGGEPLLDIRREEFRLFEDGVEQQIELFSNDPFPLSAVVLLDNDLPPKIAENMRKSAGSIAAGFSEFDEVAVAMFDTIYQPVADFTGDNDKLFDQLKRLDVSSTYPGQGSAPMTSPPRVNTSPVGPGVPTPGMKASRIGKNLDDALYAAAERLRTRDRERRKIVLIVSDGVNSRNNTFRYEDTLRQLLSADISVYAIGVGDVERNLLRDPLARYARATGGDIRYGNSRAEFESLYRTLTEQARNQYTLAYTPRGTDRTLEYHEIEVRVRRPRLTLLTREGYFVPTQP